MYWSRFEYYSRKISKKEQSENNSKLFYKDFQLKNRQKTTFQCNVSLHKRCCCCLCSHVKIWYIGKLKTIIFPTPLPLENLLVVMTDILPISSCFHQIATGCCYIVDGRYCMALHCHCLFCAVTTFVVPHLSSHPVHGIVDIDVLWYCICHYLCCSCLPLHPDSIVDIVDIVWHCIATSFIVLQHPLTSGRCAWHCCIMWHCVAASFVAPPPPIIFRRYAQHSWCCCQCCQHCVTLHLPPPLLQPPPIASRYILYVNIPFATVMCGMLTIFVCQK